VIVHIEFLATLVRDVDLDASYLLVAVLLTGEQANIVCVEEEVQHYSRPK
jgi:hypothetical protein